MSQNVVFNGTTYSIPADGDFGWGAQLTAFFIDIASGSFQKTGGAFTLTAEADFGATYGLKSTYYKSRAANPASAGAVRLGNTEVISWRNAANGANKDLTVSASDILTFGGTKIILSGAIVNADVDAAAAIAYSKLNLSASIVNADVSASAAIDYSKLNLATSIVNADINAAAAIAYSKLNLTGLIVNADIGAAAAIAYSKLNLATSIVNADINASAAIALTKLAAMTASRVPVSDGSGFLTPSSVTSTTLGYLDATSSVQTQINTKQTRSVITTKGDLYVGTASDTVARQGAGSNGSQLMADSSQTNGMRYIFGQGDVQTKTGNYTALVTDGYINCSTNSHTITLFAASGNAGKTLTITKTDSDVTKIITIDGNASETIDGATTTTLNTQYESVTLYCDGSNWTIQNRKIPSGYQSYTPTITGFGTPTSVSAYSWREGRFLCFVMYWVPGVVSGTEARASLGFAGTDSNVTTVSTLPTLSMCGTGGLKRALPDYLQVFQEASKTYVTMAPVNGSVVGLTKATGSQFPTSDVSITGKVPINGWNG